MSVYKILSIITESVLLRLGTKAYILELYTNLYTRPYTAVYKLVYTAMYKYYRKELYCIVAVGHKITDRGTTIDTTDTTQNIRPASYIEVSQEESDVTLEDHMPEEGGRVLFVFGKGGFL